MKTKLCLGLLFALFSFFGFGCGGDTNTPADTPTVQTDSGGSSSDATAMTIDIGTGHMFTGDEAKVEVNLQAGKTYSVVVWGSNDGDADSLSVFMIDGGTRTTIGTYLSKEQREGGNGWYDDFASPAFTFTPRNDNIVLGVKAEATDSWGTWPKTFLIAKE